MKRKPHAFNLKKYARRLERVGKHEASLTPESSVDHIENAIVENPRVYTYHKSYRKLYHKLKLDAVAFFCVILNIRGMEKGKGRKYSLRLKYFKKLKGKAVKELVKAIEKYPSLGIGWFRLPEERLMRELNITRRTEARLMEVLREAGLILTVVCDLPRKRFCRVNYRRFLEILEGDDEE